jgi:hypothetical protein
MEGALMTRWYIRIDLREDLSTGEAIDVLTVLIKKVMELNDSRLKSPQDGVTLRMK